MHCQVTYSTRGGSHIQLHRPILEGAMLLCSIETPLLLFCFGIRYNSGYCDPGRYWMYRVQAPPTQPLFEFE